MTSAATRRRIEGERTLERDTTGPAYEKVLRASTNEGLLQTFAALTHRVHVADGWKSGDGVPPDARALRTQRELVRAEVLRRMGANR